MLRQHPANAFVRQGIEIARSHHERWHGAGYPDGLSGNKIPHSSRIMAVADCYDAMRSRRRYKEEYSHERTREEILRGSGSQFDPEIVEAFRQVEEAFAGVSDSARLSTGKQPVSVR